MIERCGLLIPSFRYVNSMILDRPIRFPFVRRVAIRCGYMGCRSSTGVVDFGEGDRIAPYNPLRGCRQLVREGCEALIETRRSWTISMSWSGPEKAMIAARGPERRPRLKDCALATGLGDKAVSLLYERVLRKDQQSKIWVERLRSSDIRRASMRWRLNALLSRRRTGSASASATPTSRSPACCASPARRIRSLQRGALSRAVGAAGAAKRCAVRRSYNALAPPSGIARRAEETRMRSP